MSQLKSKRKQITGSKGPMELIILSPKVHQKTVPGILWIHGGGYVTGMAEMVYFSCGRMLAETFGAVVVSPAYTLAEEAPYPSALLDCFAALEYMHAEKEELGISKIIVGGESAGGGLAAALCIYARDHSDIEIAMQIPLYPMLDCYDTASSKDNHGKVWNTKRNHHGWKMYLGPLYGSASIPPYASAARESIYQNLPPCYTYVCDREPFYEETLTYVKHLQKAGIMADYDVYPGDVHAFDMLLFWTKNAKRAKRKLCEKYREYIEEDTNERKTPESEEVS